MRIRDLGAIAAAMIGLGCFATRSDVRVLQDDLVAFRAEAARADSARARQLEQMITAARDAFATLSDSVGDVSARLVKFQGDSRQELYSVEQQLLQIQELTGQSQRRLQDLHSEIETRNQQIMAPVPATPGDTTATAPPGAPPPGPYQLWTLANDQMRQESYATAREAFRQLVTAWPNSELAPEAQYWIAETLNKEGNLAAADTAYQMVVQKYPLSPKASTALYKRGLVLEGQGRCAEARAVMDQVARQFPASDEAELVKGWTCKS
jgi:tol-pal system protein YbgF